MILSKEFRFEASHQLYNHPGKCSRLHGHSWKLEVAVEGAVRPDTGMVMDYALIKDYVQPIVDLLDHRHLGFGEHQGKYVYPHDELVLKNMPMLPTSENLLIWIARQLPEEFPWIQLELNETCTSSAILLRSDFEILYRERSTSEGTNPETQEAHDQAPTGGPEVWQGSEVWQQDAQEVTSEPETRESALRRLEITDDDIPF